MAEGGDTGFGALVGADTRAPAPAAGAGVVRRGATAGSTLRRTVAGAEARVSAEGVGAGRGRTGATRGPWARWTEGPCQSPRPPGSPPSLSPPLGTAAAGKSLVPPGDTGPEPRANDATSLMSPVGASSRTACERVPEKEWFCQEASEPANSADATVCRAGASIAR
ncbi:hypothetical protein ACH4LT_08595 [Streptomyces clavifer]|uniref:hypothetical protein n=1 Tax=Streptomyces clavifer TaxID=68188 RepID=UPI0037B90184